MMQNTSTRIATCDSAETTNVGLNQPVPHWNDHDILTPLFEGSLIAQRRDEVFDLYRNLVNLRPFYRDTNGSWVISTHELGSAVLSDARFRARPLLTTEEAAAYQPILSMMLLRDGDDHAQLRRRFAPLFKTQHMDRVNAFIEADVEDTLASLPRYGSFDAIKEIARCLPARVACVLMGLRAEHGVQLVALTAPVLRLISGTPMTPQAMQALVRGSATAVSEIAHLMAREAQPTLGYLGISAGELSAAALRTDPDAADIASNLCLMFVAAYTTSMLSIGNTLALALQTPGLWQQMEQEPAMIARAAAELGRLAPAAQALQRYANEDLTLAGHQIRAGDTVVVMVAAANRDPHVYENAERIDTTRTARTLTFGAGPHGCVGVGLARRQIGSVLKGLTGRYPRLRVLEHAEHGLQVGTFVGYDALWLDAPT